MLLLYLILTLIGPIRFSHVVQRNGVGWSNRWCEVFQREGNLQLYILMKRNKWWKYTGTLFPFVWTTSYHPLNQKVLKLKWCELLNLVNNLTFSSFTL